MKSFMGTMHSGAWPFCPIETMSDVLFGQASLPKEALILQCRLWVKE